MSQDKQAALRLVSQIKYRMLQKMVLASCAIQSKSVYRE